MAKDQDTEEILIALDQVEQTIEVMSAVVSRLKYQLIERVQQNVEDKALAKKAEAALQRRQAKTQPEADNLIEEFIASGKLLH